MPQKSKLRLPPLKLGSETFGQRLSRLRKQKGLTQIDLAKKTGLVQALISDYERDRLRLHAEMIVRLARALDVSCDDLLGLNGKKQANGDLSLKVLRRLKKIDTLPASKQKALFQTIDTFLKGAGR